MLRSPLFVLPLVAAASAASVANAADIGPVVVQQAVAPISFDPMTYFHVEGGPIFSSSRITEEENDVVDKFGEFPNDRGFYVGAVLRRLFEPKWSWQVGAGYTLLRELEVESIQGDATLFSNLRFETYDVDIGFHPGGDIRNRVFGGLRVLHSADSLELVSTDPEYYPLPSSVGEAWLVGPRVGVGGQFPLGSSSFSFVAELSGAALFGTAEVFLGGFETKDVDASGPRMAFNLEGLGGLSWSSPGRAAITIGYRAQQWWGLRQATEVETDGFDRIFVDTNKLLQGVFARLAFDY
jgi:hypothetical protein